MRLLTIIVILSMMLLSSCIVVENTCPEQPVTTTAGPTDMHELFEEDVLGLIDKKTITADKVTVDGVALGDKMQDLMEHIGVPQVIDEFFDEDGVIGITNAKYETEDGRTLYIFHLENNSVSRIVLREGANERLPEGSKVKMDLATITTKFGKPDYTEDVLLANTAFRTYYYYTRGLEIYHKRKKMIGYAFIPSQPVPENLDFNRYE